MAVDEVVEHLADRVAFGVDLARATDLVAQRGGIRTTVMRCSVPAGAELDVVDVLGDRRVLATDRALGVLPDRDLVEGGVESSKRRKATGEGLADLEVGLSASFAWTIRRSRQDAEHATFGTTRGKLGRRLRR